MCRKPKLYCPNTWDFELASGSPDILCIFGPYIDDIIAKKLQIEGYDPECKGLPHTHHNPHHDAHHNAAYYKYRLNEKETLPFKRPCKDDKLIIHDRVKLREELNGQFLIFDGINSIFLINKEAASLLNILKDGNEYTLSEIAHKNDIPLNDILSFATYLIAFNLAEYKR